MRRSAATFGDDLAKDLFPDRQTDRIMAFDVVVPFDRTCPTTSTPGNLPGYGGVANGATTRRVALFEGTDEFGRLQPLLGTVADGNLERNERRDRLHLVPANDRERLLSMAPRSGRSTTSPPMHIPIHLHLVNFQILDR